LRIILNFRTRVVEKFMGELEDNLESATPIPEAYGSNRD
jgi:hypothetical protein